MRPLVRTADETPGTGSAWGSPAVDPSVAATPNTPEAAAVTQATQTANEAQRAAAAVSQLHPPPFGVAIVGADGRVSQTWMAWFTRVYQRSGGAVVTTASEMDILTELDDLPVTPHAEGLALEWTDPAPRLAPETMDWDQGVSTEAQVAMLAQQVEALTGMVMSLRERGWNRQAGLTTAAAAAPAGGTGTAAGAWSTAANRNAAIGTINNLRTRLLEVEAALKSARIL